MAESAQKAAARPGWQTSEFYVSIFSMIAPLLYDTLPATWKAALMTGAGAVYALARGLAKLGIGSGGK